MIRRPPRYTRTDTLFPYTTRFRSPRPEALIRVLGLRKAYAMGAETVHALRGVDLEIGRNEYLAVMGPSGSGKSTFMNLIGCLDTPTAGEYCLNGHAVSGLSDNRLAAIRNRENGFVFQRPEEHTSE